MDLFSRRMVGWTLCCTIEASLLLDVPNRALRQCQVEPEQLLIHTDPDSQYPGTAYRELQEVHAITCSMSMSARGCCRDNAVVESFCSTVKHELDLEDDTETPLMPQKPRHDLAC